mmetsp:Transcript_9001/g.24950  ORF Transcript_9001/g.24950 Transcript_9001/m.24950 type:complete len:250 (+) Transcript_9001:90-839(+)|eukprot:CAMPEP_0168748010 /NCGR_PEP_ID=MMETSP0724-20121128/15954_1 /TAXON_ID=265536 /ORGANISM="Amphiprora sp., Strain CCMP467" /LENGTH=249 /DNA_ID=CAMNT_0008795823 /DNA_START=39 /DNA_END=788 /DNA_ORIENTATION=+
MKLSLLFTLGSAILASVSASKGGKKGKKDEMEEGEIFYDSCVFANPTLNLASLVFDSPEEGDIDFLSALFHAGPQNQIFQECVEFALFALEEGAPEDDVFGFVVEKGIYLGGIHSGIQSLGIDWQDAICVDGFIMWLAMIDTCNFEELAPVYLIISLLLHEGFNIGFNLEFGTDWTMEDCEEFGFFFDEDRRLSSSERGSGQELSPSIKELLHTTWEQHKNGEFDLAAIGDMDELKKRIKPFTKAPKSN